MDTNVRMKMQFALNFAFVSTSFYITKNQKVTYIIFHKIHKMRELNTFSQDKTSTSCTSNK
jgi:hypothetical protein